MAKSQFSFLAFQSTYLLMFGQVPSTKYQVPPFIPTSWDKPANVEQNHNILWSGLSPGCRLLNCQRSLTTSPPKRLLISNLPNYQIAKLPNRPRPPLVSQEDCTLGHVPVTLS